MQIRQLFAFLIFSFFANASISQAQKIVPTSYEEPPVLKAEDFLPKNLITGKLHTVDSKVLNDGYLNQYLVRSVYGDFKASGQFFLEKRVFEIYAINQLKEEYPSVNVAGGAIKKTAVNIVKAPIKGAEKAYDTITDSQKLKKNVLGAPKGVFNLFKSAANAVVDVAEFTYDSGKNAFKKDKNSSTNNNNNNNFEKAGEYISDAFLDYIGYSDSYRKTAMALSVDPYTENELLKSELSRVAKLEAAVNVGGKLVPGIPGVPFTGEVNKYFGYIERSALYEDPKKIEELNKKILESLGSENLKDNSISIKALTENKAYTPITRNLLSHSLSELKDVKNVGYLIEAASKAKSKQVAYYYNAVIAKLAEMHKGNFKFEAIIKNSVLPAAVTKDGRLILPLSVDYLVWTADIARIFKNFRAQIGKEYGVKSATVLVSGKISRRCREQLIKLGANEVKIGF